jgi:hypothetical protein
MPIGAGFAPAGTSSAGYGVPDAATVPNNSVLPDLRTGLPQTGRFINPATGDYVFTADGRLLGMDTVPQLVLLAMMTTLGSSAIPTLGQTYTQIQEKSRDFQQQMATAITSALADLIKRKFVKVNSITVQQPPSNPDAGMVLFQWTDLTTGLSYKNTVGQ